MTTRRVVVMLVIGVACGDGHEPGSRGGGSASGSAPAPAPGQSFGDALAILCGKGEQPPDWSTLPPRDRIAAAQGWLDARIAHPEARALLAALADVDPSERGNRVRRAARQEDLVDCQPLALFALTAHATDPFPPDLGAFTSGTAVLDQEQVVIAVGPGAVSVEGKAIAAIDEAGAIDGLDKLEPFLRALARNEHRSLAAITIVADRSLRFEVLRPVLDVAARVGARAVDFAGAPGAEPRATRLLLGRADPRAKRVGIEPGVDPAAVAGRIQRGARVVVAVSPDTTVQVAVPSIAALREVGAVDVTLPRRTR